ncbi:hypothetical protein MMC26_003720 [Xylographa opegraphella]|nr:hypothetical protein [Xylographa opegraphella]
MSDLRCGCYYYTPSRDSFNRRGLSHLPPVDSEAHATILSTNSRTKLHQTFTNDTGNAVPECIYAFPLYDGVSVVKFTCNIGGRLLRGIVEEKNAARTTYDEAVAKGETAGLLEQSAAASDVFSTRLGNVPAGESVIVEIEYVCELRQDAETNGIRFTIPKSIAPRYGSVSNIESASNPSSVQDGSIKIVVDALMPSGSFIQGIQSPSHPIAVTMGTTSTEPRTDPSMTRASATLALGETGLKKDFVLIVLAKDNGTPKAILETHPTIPNHRALMLTLVPKFSLPPSRPEIVFVADRSGSMSGEKMRMLISALKVLLKSLPLGVKFNICSFGTSHTFLFSQSMSYTRETLATATSHLERFAADMGGTETFAAIMATIKRRFRDIPLEIILLTDGDIWQQEDLFTYLNEEVEKSKGGIRVFPLGIGIGVSHALIDGIARAGIGFSQAVQDGEKLENRLVRMLKGALSPHVTDYSLEVKYEVESEEDGFEMIDVFDKVTDGLKCSLAEVENEKPKPQAPISLFNTDEEPAAKEAPIAKGDRYADLPILPPPKLIQAPHKIPPLFPFNRTTVYLLMSPNTVQKDPTSVVLRGTSAHGPLEIEIPVEILSTPAETVHQLAARKIMQELEEGRGWIFDTKDDKGTLLQEKFPSKFSDMVEREAVRLGVQFRIAGKWCSFVAVAQDDGAGGNEKAQAGSGTAYSGKSIGEMRVVGGFQSLKRKASAASSAGLSRYHALIGALLGRRDCRFSSKPSRPDHEWLPSDTSSVLDRSNLRESAEVNGSSVRADQADLCALTGTNTSKSDVQQGIAKKSMTPKGHMSQATPYSSLQRPLSSTGLLHQNPFTRGRGISNAVTAGGALFGTSSNLSAIPHDYYSTSSRASFGPVAAFRPSTVSASTTGAAIPFGGARNAAAAITETVCLMSAVSSNDREASAMTRGAESSDSEEDPRGLSVMDDDDDDDDEELRSPQPYPPATGSHQAQASDAENVLRIIALQDFEGSWDWREDMLAIMGLSRVPEKAGLQDGTRRKIWVTLLVVVWLREKMGTEEEVWELVVEKATAWLSELVAGEELVAMKAEAGKMIRA